MSVQRTLQATPKKSYITTGDWSDYFYTYTTQTNEDRSVSGVWGEASAVDLKAGAILRENGKKLVPGVHPDVDQLYVGVYDTTTFLSGYINPNDIVFAVFNEDKPYFLPNPSGYNPSTEQVHGVGSAPTYTFGNIRVVGGQDRESGKIIAGSDYNEKYAPGFIALQNAGPTGLSGENYAGLYDYGSGNFLAVEAGSEGRGYNHSVANTGHTFVGLDGYDGDVYLTGLLRAYNSCGVATLTAGTTGAIPLSSELNLDTSLVILGRQSYTGTAFGVLTYTINATAHTLTITSKRANNTDTETNDAGTVTFLICGGDNR
jgi:hypothetical protein